ncbi:hypothetical protein M7I_7345 [Glarea lozoyensis 74030]|nr:hypothetical protein M7I_7345 [Glarea lozoyensis 74030]
MVGHVLEWTIAETCLDLRNNMPLWAIQGRRFETQKPFWNESSAGFGLREQQAKKFMEVEALSLKLRYRPRTATEEKAFRRDSVRNKNLKQILDRCAAFDSHGFNTVTLREEQERERSREFDFREAQREMNLRSAKPQYHKVHEDVKSFVQTGILNTNSPAFQPAFNTLASTAAAQYYDVTRFTQDIFVTADFARTVVPQNPTLTEFEDITTFYRPVQFILTSKVGKQVQHMVIISPYEAQQLFTYIMSLKLVTLHLYSRRLNLGFRPLDNLDLYTIGTPLYANTLPIRSIVQLNLFSGQLYFSSVKHYRETCKFLGVPYQIEDTGAVSIIQQPEKVATSTVLRAAPRDNPVKFFQEFVSNVRGDGSSIEYTHLGKTLEGILLTERDFAMDKN